MWSHESADYGFRVLTSSLETAMGETPSRKAAESAPRSSAVAPGLCHPVCRRRSWESPNRSSTDRSKGTKQKRTIQEGGIDTDG